MRSSFILTAGGLGCALILLGACGQTGDLYLPTEPEAARRATLPRTLLPVRPRAQPAAPTSLPASAPQPSAAVTPP